MLYQRIFRRLRFQKQNFMLIIWYALCKTTFPLCKLATDAMFWFVTYVNKNIESTHCECVHFQGSNAMVLFTFKSKYFSSCSRFISPIASTVIPTNYKRTHNATTRQSVWNRFYWQSKIQPPICINFGTKLYIYTCIHNLVPKVMQMGGSIYIYKKPHKERKGRI